MPSAIDRYLPSFDFRSAHQIIVDAPANETYHATRAMDLGGSIPVTILFAIRSVPHLLMGKARPGHSLTLQAFLDIGFVLLDETPPAGLVMGVVGKFWRPDSGIIRVAPEEFADFHAPGYAKGALSFTVEERDGNKSLLATETRVHCTDAPARRKFSLYWRAIAPFSGLIRRIMLDQVKSTAEEGYRTPSHV